jgi:hypothetical protein
MLYGELTEVYNENPNINFFSSLNINDSINNKIDNHFELTSNTPDDLMKDYQKCLLNLDIYRKKHEDLLANNIYIQNYLSTSQNNHFNVLNIINTNTNDTNDTNYTNDTNNTNNTNDSNDSNVINDKKISENEIISIYFDYNEKLKNNYNIWVNKYYNPQLQSIEQNIETLEHKISDYKNMFLFVINKFLKNNELNFDKKLCPICFVNEIDTCMNPCGHTICNNCVISGRHISNNKCHICRKVIKEYTKIYFSI